MISLPLLNWLRSRRVPAPLAVVMTLFAALSVLVGIALILVGGTYILDVPFLRGFGIQAIAWGLPFRIGKAVLIRDEPVTVKLKPLKAPWLVFLHTSDVRPQPTREGGFLASPVRGSGMLAEHSAETAHHRSVYDSEYCHQQSQLGHFLCRVAFFDRPLSGSQHVFSL